MADHVIDEIFKSIPTLLKSKDFTIGKVMSFETAQKYYGINSITQAEIKAISERAKKGEATASHELALCHFYGLGGCKINREEAFQLHIDAARNGHIRSIYNVAIQLFVVGYEKENETLIANAIYLLAHCANSNFAPAKYYLWRIDQLPRKYTHFYPSNSSVEYRSKLLLEAADAGYLPARKRLGLP